MANSPSSAPSDARVAMLTGRTMVVASSSSIACSPSLLQPTTANAANSNAKRATKSFNVILLIIVAKAFMG